MTDIETVKTLAQSGELKDITVLARDPLYGYEAHIHDYTGDVEALTQKVNASEQHFTDCAFDTQVTVINIGAAYRAVANMGAACRA